MGQIKDQVNEQVPNVNVDSAAKQKVIANKFHQADEKDAKENPDALAGETGEKDPESGKDEKQKKIMM